MAGLVVIAVIVGAVWVVVHRRRMPVGADPREPLDLGPAIAAHARRLSRGVPVPSNVRKVDMGSHTRV
jgi:hypothetical protein